MAIDELCGASERSNLNPFFGMAEVGPALFDDDIVTDYPRKLAIADVVREKLLSKLFQEVPHEIGVAVKDIAERKDGLL